MFSSSVFHRKLYERRLISFERTTLFACLLFSSLDIVIFSIRFIFVRLMATNDWKVNYPNAQKIASPNYTIGRSTSITVKRNDE